MKFYNKLKWVLGILLVFVLIITTNLIDRDNFVRVRDSVQTIYEDRLIAKDLIFEILKSVHEKEMALIASDSTFFSKNDPNTNSKLASLITRFEATKLTAEEHQVFNDLKQNIQLLYEAENQFLDAGMKDNTKLMAHIDNVKDNLDDLAEIQINEGSRQMSISNRAIDTVELFTQIEIFILVFLAVLIQVIVMYNPKEKS